MSYFVYSIMKLIWRQKLLNEYTELQNTLVMMKSVLEKCLSKRLKMDVFYQVDSLKLCLKTTSPLRNCFVLYKFPGN